MLRACIDTNVWISGLVFSGPPAEIVDLALKKRFHLVLSSFILQELQRNLIQKFDVTPRATKRLIYRIAEVADVYQPQGVIRAVPNRHADNMILETAILGRAKYLVTGDRQHLLPIKIHRNVKIVEPWAFLGYVKR